ncbi:MAG: hypothetical protein ABS913_07270 [Desemzia incerta]|uniref:hypothetical protein n=1 Tax=Desemzia incerta TaxID=82801 RepID=UPI0033153F6D
MKKYWKLITLIVFSVISISTFYLVTVSAENSYPQYSIETRSGDEAVIEDLVLAVSTFDENSDYGDMFQIRAEGTIGNKDVPFTQQLDMTHQHDFSVQKLYREHRGFFREKTWNMFQYHEDEDFITYANNFYTVVDDYEEIHDKLEIAVLDKKTEEETNFEVEVPDYENYDSFYVEDVQKSGNILHVFTINYIAGETELYQPISELHVYKIDLDSQKMVEDLIMAPPSSDDDTDYTSYIVNIGSTNNEMTPEPYIIISSNPTVQPENTESGVEINPEDITMMAYNVETSEVTELAVPNEFKGWSESMYPLVTNVQDEYIYYTTLKENGFEMNRFNIEENTMEQAQLIELPSEVMENFLTNPEGYATPLVSIKGNQICYVSTLKDKAGHDVGIVVADLESGQVLYDGTIKDSEKMNDVFKDVTLTIDTFAF